MADFTFNPADCNINGCVDLALNELPPSALGPINTGITTAISILQAARVILNLKVINLDILLFPLQLEQTAIQTLIDQVRGNVRLIPSDLAADCPDLGQLNIYVESILDQELAKLKALLFRINRMLSSKIQLNQQLANIDTILQYLTCFQKVLQQVQSGLG